MFTCLLIISLQVMFHVFSKPHYLYKVWTLPAVLLFVGFFKSLTLWGARVCWCHSYITSICIFLLLIVGYFEVWPWRRRGGVKMWCLRMSSDCILFLPSFLKTGQLIQKLKVECWCTHAHTLTFTRSLAYRRTESMVDSQASVFLFRHFYGVKKEHFTGRLSLSVCMPASQEVEAPRISRHLGYEGGKVVSPMQRLPSPPGNIPCTHFC
jgi:hypothetical protein